MSLDIYLTYHYPQCDCCGREVEDKEVWTGNITHNLTEMAKHVQAGQSTASLYDLLWGDNYSKNNEAWEYWGGLAKCIEYMELNKDDLRGYEPENGWGDFDTLLRFTREFYNACVQYEDATVSKWR